MRLFKRSKSPSYPSPAAASSFPGSVPSDEQIVGPAFTPPGSNNNKDNNNNPHFDNTYTTNYYDHSGPASAYQSLHPVLAPSQPGLNRSQSQRQSHAPYLRDRATVNVVAADDSQSRRSKTNLSVRASSGLLERRSSVKNKGISPTVSQANSPRPPLSTTEENTQHMQPEGHSPGTAYFHEPRSASLAYQQQHQEPHRTSRSAHQTPIAENSHWSHQQPVPPPSFGLQRSNTDPNLLEQLQRPSTAELVPEPLRSPQSHSQSQRQQAYSGALLDKSLSARPPSRQTYEPSSPWRAQTYPDAMKQAPAQAQSQQQLQGQSQQLQGQSQQLPNERPPQETGRRSSATQPMPAEPGRSTPTTSRARDVRDESGEIDVRALLQKHDELQAKYSKVKRYYFEKDAQVQHLQNTVAHQRMAVSRTVLDDNEYASRFQRLDGAIKDLAFSVRKYWRGLPSWLHGQVSEDAVSVNTKEMTAAGRAVISRWLVEEVFQRHFHPALEPNLSLQLKKIEMNLRQQSVRAQSEEDRENSAARLSNWRRTTCDGLGDVLAGSAAEEHRAELVEHLVVELASFLGLQLHDPALPGLEASVRMIIENTINITEKIPLEARDVCVDYFPPGASFVDACMKAEVSLPALSAQARSPIDQDLEEQQQQAGTGEGDSSSASNGAGGADGAAPSPSQYKPPPPKKSVFGLWMARKPAGNESGRVAPASPDEKGDGHDGSNAVRIRFAAFPAVEVRGKGPVNVLIKAPVWLME